MKSAAAWLEWSLKMTESKCPGSGNAQNCLSLQNTGGYQRHDSAGELTEQPRFLLSFKHTNRWGVKKKKKEKVEHIAWTEKTVLWREMLKELFTLKIIDTYIVVAG